MITLQTIKVIVATLAIAAAVHAIVWIIDICKPRYVLLTLRLNENGTVVKKAISGRYEGLDARRECEDTAKFVEKSLTDRFNAPILAVCIRK